MLAEDFDAFARKYNLNRDQDEFEWYSWQNANGVNADVNLGRGGAFVTIRVGNRALAHFREIGKFEEYLIAIDFIKRRVEPTVLPARDLKRSFPFGGVQLWATDARFKPNKCWVQRVPLDIGSPVLQYVQIIRQWEPSGEVIAVQEEFGSSRFWIRIGDDGVDSRWASLESRARPVLKRVGISTVVINSVSHQVMTVESDNADGNVRLQFVVQGVGDAALPTKGCGELRSALTIANQSASHPQAVLRGIEARIDRLLS